MTTLLVKKPQHFCGTIDISGSKNSALALIAASTVSETPVKITNIPDIVDVHNLLKILIDIGFNPILEDGTLSIEPKNNLSSYIIPETLASTIRASTLLISPIVAKYNTITIPVTSGGCDIGERPIDLHLLTLRKLGYKINKTSSHINITKDRLSAKSIYIPKVSVGATQNSILAAVYIPGKTVIQNIALEPEIIDLINFLRKIGFKIYIDKKRRRAIIKGVRIDYIRKKRKTTIVHKVIPDRVEAATFIISTAINGHSLVLNNINYSHIQNVLRPLSKIYAITHSQINQRSIIVKKTHYKFLPKLVIHTNPYPHFPSDVQPQLMVLMCMLNGKSKITENVFEKRFQHVPELIRMGAKIRIKDKQAIVSGKTKLIPTIIKCSNLRSAAAMLLAALSSSNNSKDSHCEIKNIEHIDRGYENIAEKLAKCNININKVEL